MVCPFNLNSDQFRLFLYLKFYWLVWTSCSEFEKLFANFFYLEKFKILLQIQWVQCNEWHNLLKTALSGCGKAWELQHIPFYKVPRTSWIPMIQYLSQSSWARSANSHPAPPVSKWLVKHNVQKYALLQCACHSRLSMLLYRKWCDVSDKI